MATAMSDDESRPSSGLGETDDAGSDTSGVRVTGSDPVIGSESHRLTLKRSRRSSLDESLEQFEHSALAAGYPQNPAGFYRKDTTAGLALFQMAYRFFETIYPGHPPEDAQKFGVLVVLVGPDRALEDFQTDSEPWKTLSGIDHWRSSSVVYNGKNPAQNQALINMRDFFHLKVSFSPDIRNLQGAAMPAQLFTPPPRFESIVEKMERELFEARELERADNEFRDRIFVDPDSAPSRVTFPLSSGDPASTANPLANLGAIPKAPLKTILKNPVQPPVGLPDPSLAQPQPGTVAAATAAVTAANPNPALLQTMKTPRPRVIPSRSPLYHTPVIQPDGPAQTTQGFRPVSTSPSGSAIEEIQRPPSGHSTQQGLGQASSTTHHSQPHLLDQQEQEFYSNYSRNSSKNPYAIRPVEGFNSFLPKCGQILNPDFAYQDDLRARHPLPTHTEESGSARLARTLDQARIPRNDPMWGYSLAMYESIRQAQEKKGKPEFSVTKINRPSYNKMNLDYFDYNGNGRTPEEILGSRFRHSIFPTEFARKETMKQIFQRCVDDPHTSPEAFDICLQQIGQSNPSVDHIDGLDQSMVRTLQLLTKSGLSTDEDLQIIPPPVLGNRHEFGPAIVKNLYSSLGLAPGTKFSPARSDSTPLSHFLPTLSSSITNNQLGREGAYSLLLSILEGDLYTEMHGALTKGVPFERTWVYIQKTNGGKIQKDVLIKELTKTFNTSPSGNNPVSTILTRLQNLREKYYSDTHPASVRKVMIEETTVRDFLNYVALHYKGEASAIETRYHEAKLAKETEQQLLRRQGYPTDDTYSNIWLLKEIISTHLSRPTMITGGLSLAFSNMSIEDGTPTIHQYSAAINPASPDILALQARIASMEAAQQHSTKQGGRKGQKNSNQSAGVDINTLQAFNQVFDSVRSIQQQNEQSAAVIDQLRNQQQQLLLQNQQRQNQQTYQPALAPVPTQPVTNPLFSDHMGPPYPNSTDPYKKNILSHPSYPVQYNNRGELKFPSVCWDKMGKGICFLCAGLDHLVRDCPVYGLQYPVPIQCECLGFHFTPCAANKTPTQGAIIHCQNRAKEMQDLNLQRQQGLYNNNNRGSTNPRFSRGGSHGGRSRGGRGRGSYNGNQNQGQGFYQNQPQDQQNQQQNQAPVRDPTATIRHSAVNSNINLFQNGQVLSYPPGNTPSAPQAPQRAGSALGNSGSQPVASGVIMNTGSVNSGFN